MALYCPNCRAELEGTASCAECDTVLGPGAAWRPLTSLTTRPSVLPPRLANAAPAVPAFVLLGPPLGGLLSVLLEHGPLLLLSPALPFILLGAYSVGFIPAALVGGAYAALSVVTAKALHLPRISSSLAAALGGVAGLVGMSLALRLIPLDTSPEVPSKSELIGLACLSASLIAAFLAHRAPVGLGSGAES